MYDTIIKNIIGVHMGIIKAIGRLGAKTVSRSVEKKAVAGASSKAYKQTGKEIAFAKKQGRYIDGSYRFKSNKSNNVRLARQKSSDREKFIDDLF